MIDRFQIEEASWRDFNELRQLENECFPLDAWPFWDVLGILSLPSIIRLKAVVDEKMIGFVDQLNNLETTGIEPLIHMSREVNVLRDDEIRGSVNRDEALKNAPNHTGSFFTVPKVISK